MKNIFLLFALATFLTRVNGTALANLPSRMDTVSVIAANSNTPSGFLTLEEKETKRMTFFEKLLAKAMAKKVKKMAKQLNAGMPTAGADESANKAGGASLYMALGGWVLAFLSASAPSVFLSLLVLVAMVMAVVFGIMGLKKTATRKQRAFAGIGLGLSALFWLIFIVGLVIILG
jgi:hypothetical protein